MGKVSRLFLAQVDRQVGLLNCLTFVISTSSAKLLWSIGSLTVTCIWNLINRYSHPYSRVTSDIFGVFIVEPSDALNIEQES